MSTESALKVLNIAGSALDLLAQYNISEQKLVDLRAANGGAPITADDLAKLSNDAQNAINAIQG